MSKVSIGLQSSSCQWNLCAAQGRDMMMTWGHTDGDPPFSKIRAYRMTTPHATRLDDGNKLHRRLAAHVCNRITTCDSPLPWGFMSGLSRHGVEFADLGIVVVAQIVVFSPHNRAYLLTVNSDNWRFATLQSGIHKCHFAACASHIPMDRGEVSILHFATVNFEVSIVKNDT
jgi:hypothetical protein